MKTFAAIVAILGGALATNLAGVSAGNSVAAKDAPAHGKAPQVFVLDAKQLQLSRQRLHSGDKDLSAAWARLEREAQKALAAGPFSVVVKETTPPSGDKHDYLSQAPYFWPNPQTAGGLPYIHRDGERNPEINKITDSRNLDQMESAVETLALAYYFKGDELYAAKATQLLRAFFLDPATRMNPNLQFGQFVPGVNTGRGIALIETRGLIRVVDAIGLLAGSKAWTGSDQNGLHAWFGDFLQWMLTSKNGRDEAAAKNNHGSFYDAQVVSFALFLDKRDLAIKVLEAARQKRIAAQLEADGRQRLELARTKSWSYSCFNLEALMLLATLGERVGVDLWHYQTSEGRGIYKALDFLLPFAFGERKWEFQQLGGVEPQILWPLLRHAAIAYQGKEFQELLAKLPELDLADRSRLLRASAVWGDRRN